MILTVTGRHLVVSAAARAQIDRKIERVQRILGGSALSAQCVVSRERQQFVCEVTVHARGDHQLHAVARHNRLISALTAAVEKVSQQAHTLAGRWKARRRAAAGGRGQAGATEAGPGSAPSFSPRVIRTRNHVIKPMTVDDAVVALAASRDALLVFRQAPSEALAVLYRRPDGHFGLIESEA
jgi:ribosome hibernation promoting factor